MDSLNEISILVILGGCVVISLRQLYLFFLRRPSRVANKQSKTPSNHVVQNTGSSVTEIIPLPDFDWSVTEPLKFRPFKPKYHLTMAITNSTMSDMIVMDKNYLDRLKLRRQIIQDHYPIALACLPPVKAAVDELYTYLFGTHLPTRFPRMFKISIDEKHQPHVLNVVTNEYLPLEPPENPENALQILGENLDEDILFLLPSEDGDGYVLNGYVTCFPSGFNTREKLGMKLRNIHTPVPGYKEKLEKSMDRFFDKLEVGKIVMRSNWAITTHDRLFAAHGNHLYDGEEVVEEVVDIDNTHLRSERQLLHRLPKTKALIFNFKTYLYPLQDIKDEGLGEELAQAIDGLKEGSVPGMHFYKRGVVWGEAVKAFLRS